mmetsp:Transcript_16206/g.21817  ORF Transcript_16206/g.21817 Transcript_16206/m.21817 type:complete len:170 (+) Transcript_16206:58-567(+)
MSEGISVAGYVLIFVSCAIVFLLYLPWLWRRQSKDATHPGVVVAASTDREGQTPLGVSVRLHCVVGMLGALCAAAGNIMAYRVVLVEHLQGTVVQERGVGGVITTLLISGCLLFLFGSHCALMGADAMPQRPRRVAVVECSASALTLLIIIGKFSMGIVMYEKACCACT